MTPATATPHRALPRQRGAALLVLMLVLGLLAAYFAVSALNRASQNERVRINANVMAQAKDALLGFAATYRDSHANQVFGYLPCADLDNNGAAGVGGIASVAPSCPNQDISAVGRLPWQADDIDGVTWLDRDVPAGRFAEVEVQEVVDDYDFAARVIAVDEAPAPRAAAGRALPVMGSSVGSYGR